MATKEQIFGILAGASGAMSRVELEEKVGEKYSNFQSQLDRWVHQELLQDTGEHHYILTDKGREEVLKRTEFSEVENEPGFREDKPPQPTKPAGKTEEQTKTAATSAVQEPGLAGEDETQESLATTEYQQFLKIGKVTGVVPLALIKQVADYVWEGGDFRDMKWVAQAMKDMDIRQDLRSRWWNSWRVKMNRPIPADLPADFLPGKKTDEKTEAKKEGAGKRDYILGEDDKPTYVGMGLGDLDYSDALDLAKVRAARGRGDGRTSSGSNTIDDILKVVQFVRSTDGERSVGKSYVVKPGENGFQVEEVDPGKPILVPQGGTAKAGPSYLVDNDGSVKEIQAGAPVVIVKEAKPVPTSGSRFLIDKSTGKMEEVAPGQPVIIFRENNPNTPQLNPIQFTDKDGKPMVLDLSTFIKLEEHRDKQRRDDESHETKLEIAKAFKDMLKKAGTALGNMTGTEEQ